MSLTRKNLNKNLKLKEAAEILNCSVNSIRTGAIGNFKLFRLSDKRTSPLYVKESEVGEFVERRERIQEK